MVWATGLVALLVIVALLGLDRERARWLGRNLDDEIGSLLPTVACGIAGCAVALRIGWLARRAERDVWDGWVFSILAFVQSLTGASTGVFVLVCALLGVCGQRGDEYPEALEVLFPSLIASLPCVLAEILVLFTRWFAGSPSWTVHLLAPLAWLFGVVTLFSLGLGMLD